MEDFILREINKIGLLIEGILIRVGILKKSNKPDEVRQTVKTELLETLDLDVDTLLAGEDLVGTLVDEHKFSNDDLEKFAELLFDFAAASPDRDERIRFAAGIGAIYSYLDGKKHPVSLNRYYILKDLKKHVE